MWISVPKNIHQQNTSSVSISSFNRPPLPPRITWLCQPARVPVWHPYIRHGLKICFPFEGNVETGIKMNIQGLNWKWQWQEKLPVMQEALPSIMPQTIPISWRLRSGKLIWKRCFERKLIKLHKLKFADFAVFDLQTHSIKISFWMVVSFYI